MTSCAGRNPDYIRTAESIPAMSFSATGGELLKHFEAFGIDYKRTFYRSILPFRMNESSAQREELIGCCTYVNIWDDEFPRININRTSELRGNVEFLKR